MTQITSFIADRLEGFALRELAAVRRQPSLRHIKSRKSRQHRETPQAHANSIADVLSEASTDTESAESALNLAACLKDARTDGFKPRITRAGDGFTVRAGRASSTVTISTRQMAIVQRVIALANDRECVA